MYLIGPAASRRMGYRIAWQIQATPVGGSGIRRVTISDNAVFVLDGQNFLTRLRADSGERIWKLPVAGPFDNILGVTFVADRNRVLLTLGGEVLVLDGVTGSQIRKERLDRIANTEPLIGGQDSPLATPWYSSFLSPNRPIKEVCGTTSSAAARSSGASTAAPYRPSPGESATPRLLPPLCPGVTLWSCGSH